MKKVKRPRNKIEDSYSVVAKLFTATKPHKTKSRKKPIQAIADESKKMRQLLK